MSMCSARLVSSSSSASFFRFAENRPPQFSSTTTTISGKIGQQTIFSFFRQWCGQWPNLRETHNSRQLASFDGLRFADTYKRKIPSGLDSNNDQRCVNINRSWRRQGNKNVPSSFLDVVRMPKWRWMHWSRSQSRHWPAFPASRMLLSKR